MTISGFGHPSFNRKPCKRVQLTLHSQHDHHSFQIEAIEVPEICDDLPRLTEPTALHELEANEMPFADASCFDVNLEPGLSILIGADCYWKLVTGNIQRLNENLTAVETVFGWTVQGNATSMSPTIDSGDVKSFHVAVEGRVFTPTNAFSGIDHVKICDSSENCSSPKGTGVGQGNSYQTSGETAAGRG